MRKSSTLINSSAESPCLDRGRQSVREAKWAVAFAELWAADQSAQLEPVDLEELAKAAHLIGRDTECAEILARAHQGFLSRGEIQAAVRCAYRLGFTALVNGDLASRRMVFARRATSRRPA
jgi:predicted metalloprotease